MTDPMRDDVLDGQIRDFLRWQARETRTAPSAMEMADRIHGRVGATRWRPTLAPGLVWGLLAALLAVALIAAAVAGAKLLIPAPLGAPRNGLIAVSANPSTVDGGESGDIYVLANRVPARRIIGFDGDGAAQACPRFSPDGKRLAYGEARAGNAVTNNRMGYWAVAGRSVVVVDVNSEGDVSSPIARVTLAPEPGDMACPEWSPDGRSVAFRSERVLSVADVASGRTKEFSIPALGQAWSDFEWSRDGASIAVAASGQIRVLRVADGTWTSIDVGGASPISLGWTAGDARIVYIATAEGPTGEGTALHVVDADGQEDVELTHDVPPSADEAVNAHLRFYGAAVSPDGTRIALVEYAYSCTTTQIAGGGGYSNCTREDRLVAMDLDGSRRVELAIPDGSFSPAFSFEDRFGLQWSPDGQRLLLGSFAGIVSIGAEPGSAPIVHSSGELNLAWSSSRFTWQPVFSDGGDVH